jgi:hypothetical protein
MTVSFEIKVAPPTVQQLLEFRLYLAEFYQDVEDEDHGCMVRETMHEHIVARVSEKVSDIKARVRDSHPGWRFSQIWNLSERSDEVDF